LLENFPLSYILFQNLLSEERVGLVANSSPSNPTIRVHIPMIPLLCNCQKCLRQKFAVFDHHDTSNYSDCVSCFVAVFLTQGCGFESYESSLFGANLPGQGANGGYWKYHWNHCHASFNYYNKGI